MAKAKSATSKAKDTAANLGFEAKLWLTADMLRNNINAAEHKHIVLGQIFLKYFFDTSKERHKKSLAERRERGDPEDSNEYRAENVFWFPTVARLKHKQDRSKQLAIDSGSLVGEPLSLRVCR